MVDNMENVLSKIKNEHLLTKYVCLLIGTFIYTFIYNKFLVPYSFVTGGVSGVAILVQEVFKISTTTFINICNVILVILSFIILGKKKTVDQLIGTVIYLMMLNITAPLAEAVNIHFESTMLMVIIISVVIGISNGLIYRPGFSTGGSDYLSMIMQEKLKVPFTKVSLVFNIIVIGFSAFVFSIPTVMFSIFVIYVSNRICNAVIFGVSTKKMVYVISKASDEIEDYIMNKINTGATEIKVRGGALSKNRQMLLCVVHNTQYSAFKESILAMDQDAFILSNNCYEVSGGKKFNILPF